MKKSFSTSFLDVTFLAVIFISSLSLLSLVSTQNATKKICQTKQCLSAAQNLKESINFKVDPCDDFYKYACGNWPNVHKNPNIIPGSTILLRNDENTAELYDFLKKNNSKDEPEAVHKTRQLYALCLNEAAYSNKLKPIEDILQKIGIPVLSFLSDEIKNYDYTTALARTAKLAGIKIYFELRTSSNPYNHTLNMIGLGKIAPTPEIDATIMPLISLASKPKKRATEKISGAEYMAEVMRRMCENSTSTSCLKWNSPNNFERDIIIEKILTQNTETALISAKPTSALNSSLLPVIYTLKQLQDLTDSIAIEVNTTIPKLNWTRYIEETFSGLENVTLDLSDPTKVQIAIESLDFIKEMIRFIYERKNVKLIELGLWWEVVSKLLPYTDLKIFDTKNKVSDIGDATTSTREQRCAEIAKLSFGMAVSYAYATKEKYIEAKTIVTKLMHLKINDAQWFATKSRRTKFKIIPKFDLPLILSLAKNKLQDEAGVVLCQGNKKNYLMGYFFYKNYERRSSEETLQVFLQNLSFLIRKMFEHIRASLKQIIQEVSWMDETTKQRALKKLQSVKSYVVYPNAIKTNKLNDFYQDVKISNNFYDTMITKIQNQVKKVLNMLNQTNDQNEDDWMVTPNLVNALYLPEKNSIIIPAGILGLSIYTHSLRALDYGAIGSIIGHELTHAFDNTGRRYNELGNIESWWQPETSNSYREKAKCFVKAYGNYSTNFGGIQQMGDSKVTLGEDISDSGGFKESLFAYKKCVSEFGDEPMLPQFENFTHEQLLTVAFANVWCENPTIVSSLINEFNDHSPNGVRVNGVLKNSKEFAEIWKCPKGSKMNPNTDKCSIW